MPSENSGRSGTNTAAKAAAKAAPAAAVKAVKVQKAEIKQQASQTAAKNKSQQGRDVSRSSGRNSPVSKTNPGPTIYTPLKKGTGTGSGSSKTGSGSSVENTAMDLNPVPYSVADADPVKIATRNITDISSLVPQFNPEHIAKILFENMSAIELSIVERHDTIQGINQRYSIISNLSEIRKKYDISKQLSIMDKFNPLTSIYPINIEDKIPQEDYLALENLNSTYQYLDENNQVINREKGYYYIDTNGDLVIELINLEADQQVEVYIDTNGTIYNIDKVEL